MVALVVLALILGIVVWVIGQYPQLAPFRPVAIGLLLILFLIQCYRVLPAYVSPLLR